jgi:hypothetical protein
MSSIHHAVEAAGGIQKLNNMNHWLMFDMGGGPRPFKLAWVINLQKAGSFPFFVFLIWYYADKTPAATSYGG